MAVSPETWQNVKALLVYAGGILVYALLVTGFYKILSRRIMFYSQTRQGRIVPRTALYIVTFPFVSFGFFLLLAEALLFMGRPDAEPLHVITIAMAIVLAVRVSAYVNEHASEDLAKTLPLGLLGVFLVTGEFTNVRTSIDKMLQITDHLETIGIFFGILVAVEILLRIFRLIYNATQKPTAPPPRPPSPRMVKP